MRNIQYIDRVTGELKQEIVPGEKWLQWLYHNPFGKLALQGVVKRKFLTRWYGNTMDSPSSTAKIPGFIRDVHVDMSEVLHPLEDFSTFNDFFIRQLKPDARPINRDPLAVVSPADGKAVAFAEMQGLDTFFVKGQKFSLCDFLQDRDLACKYEGGTLLIIRLAPVDYHRFHFPADGRITKSALVDGSYYSVSPYAVKERIKIYWENKREYSTLETENAGDILLCEVGATMVGSIVQTYPPETYVKKGQEKGWFAFGGSTIVILFEKGKVHIDPDIITNTKNGYETSMKMGEQLASAQVS